jgi:alanyl-tRNA synthetase
LLRRAVKHGKTLGIDRPFLFELVEDVIRAMGDFYPYLNDKKELVQRLIKLEEQKFHETLVQGEKILEHIIEHQDHTVLSGQDAFTLYDTYGFPLELTVELAAESGFRVDIDGFHNEMKQQKERARSARKHSASMNEQNEAFLTLKTQDVFTGYDSLQEETRILKAFDQGVVLERTPFYAESGGQVADRGVIRKDHEEYDVLDVQKLPNGQFLHLLEAHDLKDGDAVVAQVDEHRRNLTMYNHSATHLLFAALRELVGDHVSQQGSNVSSEGMRFDFNHYTILDDETMLALERRVNEKIAANIAVDIEEKPIDEAKAMGAIAEFGEKYSDKVRVVNMDYTVDLCGGTHVHNTGDIGRFAIASIENKGSGIYRITGHANESIEHLEDTLKGFNEEIDKLIQKGHKIVEEAKEKGIDLTFDLVRNRKIKGSYQDIIDKRQEFQHATEVVKELDKAFQAKAQAKAMSNLDEYLAHRVGNTLVLRTDGLDKNSLRPLADRLMDHLSGGVVVIANVEGDKVTFVVKSQSKDHHAGNLAKAAASICGGGGGGRPDMAQAGGKDISRLDEALAYLRDQLA